MGLEFNNKLDKNVFGDALQNKVDDVKVEKEKLFETANETKFLKEDTKIVSALEKDALELSNKIEDEIIRAEKEAIMGEALEKYKKDEFDSGRLISFDSEKSTNDKTCKEGEEYPSIYDFKVFTPDETKQGKDSICDKDSPTDAYYAAMSEAQDLGFVIKNGKIITPDGKVYTKPTNYSETTTLLNKLISEYQKTSKSGNSNASKTDSAGKTIQELLASLIDTFKNLLEKASDFVKQIVTEAGRGSGKTGGTNNTQNNNTTTTTTASTTTTQTTTTTTTTKTIKGSDCQVNQIELDMPSCYYDSGFYSQDNEVDYYKTMVTSILKYGEGGLRLEEYFNKWKESGFSKNSAAFNNIKRALEDPYSASGARLSTASFVRTYLEENVYPLITEQIKKQLQAKGFNASEIEKVCQNALDSAVNQTIKSANISPIVESITQWSSDSYRRIQPKEITDKFFENFNNNIKELIDGMNSDSKDFDIQDIDFGACYNTGNSKIDKYLELSYNTNTNGRFVSSSYDNEAIKAGCEKIKAQLLQKAKDFCSKHGVAFNQNVFNNLYNNALSTAMKQSTITYDDGTSSSYYNSMYDITHDLVNKFQADITDWVNNNKS